MMMPDLSIQYYIPQVFKQFRKEMFCALLYRSGGDSDWSCMGRCSILRGSNFVGGSDERSVRKMSLLSDNVSFKVHRS